MKARIDAAADKLRELQAKQRAEQLVVLTEDQKAELRRQTIRKK